jgi:hypothetical protein
MVASPPTSVATPQAHHMQVAHHPRSPLSTHVAVGEAENGWMTRARRHAYAGRHRACQRVCARLAGLLRSERRAARRPHANSECARSPAAAPSTDSGLRSRCRQPRFFLSGRCSGWGRLDRLDQLGSCQDFMRVGRAIDVQSGMIGLRRPGRRAVANERDVES